VAQDVKANPCKIQDYYPRDDWVMHLTKLEEKTGEFRAVKVGD
jgi:hypothetical protein